MLRRWREPGTGFGDGLADVDRLVAFVADDFGVHVVAAGRVVEHEWCAFGSGEPFVAPGGHGGENGVHLSPLVGEAVLVAQRSFLVWDPGEQAVVNQSVEVGSEDVPADTERFVEVIESAGSEAGLADDQQIPAVAEEVCAARHSAGPA